MCIVLLALLPVSKSLLGNPLTCAQTIKTEEQTSFGPPLFYLLGDALLQRLMKLEECQWNICVGNV